VEDQAKQLCCLQLIGSCCKAVEVLHDQKPKVWIIVHGQTVTVLRPCCAIEHGILVTKRNPSSYSTGD